MLAYIFWHWPRPQVAAGDYEADLIAFHGTLAADAPPGFRRSLTFRVGPLPWLGDDAGGYEDWYVVADSAALDPLNTAAVSGRRKPSHDRAARAAAGGAGGLYRHQSGEMDLIEARHATWLHKPGGMTYAQLDVQMQAWIAGAACSLWQRQMVLGPGREYFLLSRDALPCSPFADILTTSCRALGDSARVDDGVH